MRTPDIINVGAKCLRCAEVLFQPSFTGKETSGFFDTPSQKVTKCDVYIRKEMYATVVESGGTDMFQGIVAHMKLTARTPCTRDLEEDFMKILTEQGYSVTGDAVCSRCHRELHAFRLRH